MPTLSDSSDRSPAHAVTLWLKQINAALAASSPSPLRNLFLPESYWRDALALSWQLETHVGHDNIAACLYPLARSAGLQELQLDETVREVQQVRRFGAEVLEAFIRFETRSGRGEGVVRLVPSPDVPATFLGWTLLTALDELKGFEEAIGPHRPAGEASARKFHDRIAEQAYGDRDPTVLVVGGGQAGLAAAARLKLLGVDTLIIDRHGRIGDNWRKRYHALTLHNQVQVNHMPYMPFPPSWPAYIPKDKLANWFEAYVEALELNYWTNTELISAVYDCSVDGWVASLQGPDNVIKTLHPAHIVMATGVSGIANIPELPGLERFSGKVMHSSAYRDGQDWAGRSAMVIGTGNSGHDIAQDLCSRGANVTMVQRSPTLVVSIEPGAQLPYTLYDEGPGTEVCDLLTVATPLPLARRAHQGFTRQARELDDALLGGLQSAGFKLDFGEDDTGWQFKYLTRGGGYYFNVGCSDLIVSGRIGLLPYEQIDSFTAEGVRMVSGEVKAQDLVVLATGYQPQEVLVERLFGKEVRERVGPIWGFGEGLELRNMYSRTGQPGLWFIAGSLAQCRINSKYLALQIKACQEGLIGKTPYCRSTEPMSQPAPAGRGRPRESCAGHG